MLYCLIDLDGTLADSIPVLWRAYHQFMTELGLPAEQEDFFSLMGPSLREIFTQLKERYRFIQDPEELSLHYLEKLYRYYAEEIPLMHGAKEVLLKLSPDVSYAIVTSAPAKIAWAFLDAHGLRPVFKAVFTAEGLPSSKPHPAIYQRALESLACEATSAIAIEDSPAGVRSARGAGIPILWLTDPPAVSNDPYVIQVSNWQQIGERLQQWKAK